MKNLHTTSRLLLILILFSIASIITLNAQWEPCNNGIGRSEIWSFIADSINTYAAGDRGVFMTTNNGDNWIAKNNNISGVIDIFTSFAIKDNYLFVGTSSFGVFLSTDKGDYWIQKSNGFPGFMDGLYDDCVNTLIINNNDIFAGTDKGILFSSDNGDNWIFKNKGLPPLDSEVFSIVINGNNILAGTRFGIYISTNNGNNWFEKNKGLTDFFGLTLAINGNNIFNGTISVIYLSNNNADNWIAKYIGDSSLYVSSIMINGNFIFAGTYHGILFSTDNGDNWSEKNTGLNDVTITSLIINGNYIFAGTQDSGVYRAKLSDFGITDVKETNRKNGILISPNPVIDYLNISSPTELPHGKIEIFSIEGIKMLETEVVSRIDVRALCPGVYFVKYGSRVEKFVKM